MAQVGQQRFGCYIGNIDRSVTLEVLRQVFSQCGVIIDCSLNGRDEDPYRYGFIDFATEDDRARAMKYNGFTLAGRKIKVGISKGNVGRPEGYNNTATPTPPNNNGGGPGKHTHQQHQPASQTMALPQNFIPGIVPPQQQPQGAALLLQLIQQGAIDVNNLTPEQQQILMASLLPQAAPAAGGIAPMPPTTPMPYIPPPPQHPWGGPRGHYQGGTMRGRAAQYTRPPATSPPPEEIVKLREVQRKQFLEVVRRDAERYERKLVERSAKENRACSVSGSEESSSEEEVDRDHPRSRRKEEEDEKEEQVSPGPREEEGQQSNNVCKPGDVEDESGKHQNRSEEPYLDCSPEGEYTNVEAENAVPEVVEATSYDPEQV
uniref:Uncharacterized protein TCIL3000_10_11940 n=1 Tax=Trypanosoma congolense (strain IL3000) TaxID=1068625 RepID=G0UYE6_TRYCI|nr:unnamed protein product [Trypanosoma congolense IL3000]